jgi:hypothetical protein
MTEEMKKGDEGWRKKRERFPLNVYNLIHQ